MSDIMGERKTTMTGAIATFKDLGYTIGPLAAGTLMGVVACAARVRLLDTCLPSLTRLVSAWRA